MREIGIKEVQQHLLGIAKEFDRICTSHNIPYFMIYGTMLGAVRHKGFIPWDDDMDFGVPVEYYKQMEEVMEKELKYPYKLCTYKNSPASLLPYAKIEDKSTIMYKKTLRLPIEKQMGVNIDIFPLNRCNIDDRKPFILSRMNWLLGGAFTNSKKNISFFQRICKSILRIILGGNPKYLQCKIEKLMYQINEGDRIGYVFGAGTKNTLPEEWFGNGTRYQFDDTTLVGPDNFDGYLKHIFGDYMTLPPVEERPSHAENVYVR